MSTGEILLGRVPGHEIKKKKKCVSKKENKDQLSNPAAALKQLSREDGGTAASLNREELV